MTQTLISQPVVQVADTLVERCDRCGAAARLVATLGAVGDLAFCGHHGNRYADRILASADGVTVETGYDWRGSRPLDSSALTSTDLDSSALSSANLGPANLD